MKLLMIDYGIGSGTETLLVQLLKEFLFKVEHVVVLAPQYRIQHLSSKLPKSPGLTFETAEWGEEGWQWLMARLMGRINWMGRKLEKQPQSRNLKRFVGMIQHLLFQWRVRRAIKENKISHALCHWFLHEKSIQLGIPLGLIIQDLNWHEFPENFTPFGQTQKQLDAEMLDWCRAATLIFPISDYTRGKLDKSFPQLRSKLFTVPHGARAPTSDHDKAKELAPNPGKKVLLYYPGSVYAHKNHCLLLRAVARLFSEGLDFELVMTGWLTDQIVSTSSITPDYLENCRQYYIENKELWNGRVACRGIVPEAEVEALYGQASLVVLPSAYEGFGLPLVESLERGCRVICSDIHPFREQISRYEAASIARTFPSNDLSALVHCLRSAHADIINSKWSLEHVAALDRWTWSDAADAYIHGLTTAH